MKERIAKILEVTLYWSIVVFPFSMGVAPGMMNTFMGFIVVSFLGLKAIKRERLLVRSNVNLPLLAFFIITCVSIIHSVSVMDTLKGGIFRLLFFLAVFYAVLDSIKDRKHVTLIAVSACAGLVFVSIDSIWQVLSGKDFVRGYDPVINLGMVRATASFKDSNTLGVYLSALAPLAFGLTMFCLKGKKLLAGAVVSLLGMAGIYLTYSRPTLLAIYIVLLFFALAKKAKMLLACLLIVIALVPFIIPKSVKNWAREMEYNPLRIMCNDDRIAVYRNSLRMIKAHPVLGVGANNFMKSYKQYKEYPEYRNVVTIDYIYAHNNFLHMAGELGLMGLGIFIWFLASLFKECSVVYRKLSESYLKIMALSLIACLIAFLINGLTESSLYYSRVAAIFWFQCAYCLGLRKFINA